jgi:type IV pilus assembly protein PilB
LNDAALQKHLVSSGLLDPDTLEQVLQFARSRRRNVAESVLELGLLAEPELYKAVAKAHGMSFVDPGGRKIAASLTERIPAELALENRALPVVQKGDVLYIAIDDPDRVFVLDNLAFVAGCELKAALAPPSSLESALSSAYGGAAMPTREEEAAATAASVGDDADAPIIRLVHKVIETALERRASDIHIEPFENDVRVRYRIDGVLHETGRHPKNLQAALTSRLKLMASLDIAEKRKPQDGRIQLRIFGREIDIRTSVLPGNHGETIVMRLLDREESLRSLTSLGFVGDDYERFQRLIKRPNGIFLVTGPTGSGKTTTLYAALSELNRPDVKIITAEDPVEYQLSGINQCQVRVRSDSTLRGSSARCCARRPTSSSWVRSVMASRGDRDPGGANRPPRVLDAAHQRRALRARAPDRHGRQAIPRLGVGAGGPGAAPDPHPLPALQEGIRSLRERTAFDRPVQSRRPRTRLSAEWL